MAALEHLQLLTFAPYHHTVAIILLSREGSFPGPHIVYTWGAEIRALRPSLGGLEHAAVVSVTQLGNIFGRTGKTSLLIAADLWAYKGW